METINVNGAILTDSVISEIKILQDPDDELLSGHMESITSLVEFLIEIRKQVTNIDSKILDHCEALNYIRKTLEAFQVR